MLTQGAEILRAKVSNRYHAQDPKYLLTFLQFASSLVGSRLYITVWF